MLTKVYLVNIDRYFRDYPFGKEKRFKGYTDIRVDIKTTRFNGIEFFCAMPREVYQRKDGALSFKGTYDEKVFNVLPVGIVPYEWIEHIDSEGDEYSNGPLFYCYFKGRTGWNFWKRLLFFGYPYKKLIYYRLSENQDHNRNDHPNLNDMKYHLIDQEIRE